MKMDDHEMSEFIPELVEEQLTRLSDSSSPLSRSGRLVMDLSQMYQDDEHSLQKVWQRLGLEVKQPADVEQQTRKGQQASPAPRQATGAQVLDFERKRPMHRTRKNNLIRTISLLAAACVAAVIVGGMLLISNLAHQRQSSQPNVAASLTATPARANLPQGIYTFNQTAVYRLDPRTHQSLWQYKLADVAKIVVGSQAVYLLQSRQSEAAHTQDQTVVALDAQSGRKLWVYTVPPDASAGAGAFRNLTDLVFAQDRLYVAQQTFDGQSKVSGQVYVLDAVSGQKLAVYANASAWSLAAGNGVIAVSGDYSLQVYRAADGKLLWSQKYEGGSSEPVRGITIANSLVYASISTNNEVSGDGQDYIAAYDLASGHQTWKSPVFPGSSLDPAFTVDQQRIYFATFALNGRVDGQPQSGAVYAYDTQHNRRLWSTSINGGGQASLIINNGVLYTAGDNGSDLHAHLVALDLADGTHKWEKTLSTGFVESLVVSNGVVYAGGLNAPQKSTAKPAIEAFNAASGQKLWSETRYGTEIVATA